MVAIKDKTEIKQISLLWKELVKEEMIDISQTENN